MNADEIRKIFPPIITLGTILSREMMYRIEFMTLTYIVTGK